MKRIIDRRIGNQGRKLLNLKQTHDVINIHGQHTWSDLHALSTQHD